MMSSVAPQRLLLIVGMHRSGTSALCAALAASGASFGEELLEAMPEVNEEGFWEDAEVVAINEQLLASTESSWYAPVHDIATVDWNADRYAGLRQQGLDRLQKGFGDASLQAIKDPRLCLTLPFWLSLCEELCLPFDVCVISRAPVEIARSLQKRDGFPLGYGLRLYALYRDAVARFAPAGSFYVRYDDLLSDESSALSALTEALSLGVDSSVESTVRAELRHHRAEATNSLISVADNGRVDMDELLAELNRDFPVENTLREFAAALTTRGQELAEIGSEHARALATLIERDRDIESLSVEHRKAMATIDQRDAEIDALSAEHRNALATIDERDEQIREFDRRLSKLGDEHSHALEVLRQRDAELAWIKQRLERVSKIPGVGYLIRRLRNHAQG